VDPRFILITRGGIAIREDMITPGKIIEESRARRAVKKTQEFDPRKEKKTFEEAIKEFERDQASSSKEKPEVR
jgi:predicted O-methyltransferase YrrM